MGFFFKQAQKKIVKKKTNKSTKLEWKKADDVQDMMQDLVISLDMKHIKSERVFCYRTTGSKARAYARIWSFPKIFQDVLTIDAAYVLEIISEKFDKLSQDEKKRVIIHELLHIPKNFSGSLLPHSYGHTQIEREVEVLFRKYTNNR
jgi:predicted metallopeptidase